MIKHRLERLERASRFINEPSRVVIMHRDETEEEAISRVWAGKEPHEGWKCILLPEVMTVGEWIAEYGQ